MTKAEKINKLILWQMEIDKPILFDEDKLDVLYKQFELINTHRQVLLMHCESYKAKIKSYSDRQANDIQTLSGYNLVCYCMYHNLKTHHNKALEQLILIIKGCKRSLNDIYRQAHQALIDILKPNKKYLNHTMKQLFILQNFIDSYDENLYRKIYQTLDKQYDFYIQNLEDKYMKMNDDKFNEIYTTYEFMKKLM